MPANKYALLRYRIIDKCIRNKYRPFPTKEELRHACEEALYGSDGDRISESTIEKDLWAMRNETELGFYAPIKFSKVEKGYYYEDPEYSIDAIPLNEDDVDAIRFAATTLFQFKDVEVFKQFEFAIEKIFDRLNITDNVDDQAINRYVQFETIAQANGSEFLGTLLHCIKERQIVEFSYEPFVRAGTKEYRIEPYLLKEYRNRWYLIGYNRSREAFLTYGLDRMTSLRSTEEVYQSDDQFNPDRFFKHSIGITSYDAEPVDVILSFSTTQGKYVKSQPLHHSQKVLVDDEKEYRIVIHVLISYELVMLLLGYGKEMKVLAPEKLVENVKEILSNSLSKYN